MRGRKSVEERDGRFWVQFGDGTERGPFPDQEAAMVVHRQDDYSAKSETSKREGNPPFRVGDRVAASADDEVVGVVVAVSGYKVRVKWDAEYGGAEEEFGEWQLLPKSVGEKGLTTEERHQLKIARDTLNMPDAMVGVMGGPSKEEARRIVAELEAKQREKGFGEQDDLSAFGSAYEDREKRWPLGKQ